MATIKEQPRLIDRVALCNMLSRDRGLGITVLLSGQHGIGKSMIIRKAAEKLGGSYITVECSQVGEGVVSGLPFAIKNDTTGSTEVRFIKFYAFNKIADLQKHYYEIATTKGFLNGTLKMNSETGVITYNNPYTNKTETYNNKDIRDIVIEGEENKYKFGEALPPEIRAKLISSGEIKPIFLFFDEINRADMMAQKEFMNIILNRSVNGYDLPWWTEIVAAMNPVSQNSSYAVNEMDPAQLDRFLKIKVHSNLDEWVEYALDKGLNQDIITGLAMSEECFIDKNDKSLSDETEMTPSPRSWEMISNLYSTIDEYNKFKINDKFVFSDDEQQEVKSDLRSLMIFKVGPTAASTVLAAIADKENNIKPEDILTGKEPKIKEEVLTKLKRQKALRQTITIDNVIRYIATNICKYEKNNKSSDPKIKSTYFNFCEQIKEFVNSLNGANQVVLAKKLINNIIVAEDGKKLFTKIAKCFAKDMVEKLIEYNTSSNSLNN